MKKNILFFPQNDTHIKNMLPFAEALRNDGHYCRFLDTTGLYHQNLQIPSDYISNFKFSLNTSFYRLSALNRLLSLFRFKKQLKYIFSKNWDTIIIGNDGAFQRILLNHARKQKIHTILLLDGIISDYDLRVKDVINYSSNKFADSIEIIKNKLRNLLWRSFRNTALSPFIPSEIGGFKVDDIVTIGEHSAHVIKKRNSTSNIHSWGLPRFWNTYISAEDIYKEPNVLTYYPSAFKWHHLENENKWQQKDIHLLCEVIEEYNKSNDIEKRWRLRIKIHPRENEDDYADLISKYNFLQIIKDKSIEYCLLNSTLNISSISTVIVEALKLGVTVYSLMINFEYWKYKYSFINAEIIPKIYTTGQLKNLLLHPTQLYSQRIIKETSKFYCNSINNMDKYISLINIRRKAIH